MSCHDYDNSIGLVLGHSIGGLVDKSCGQSPPPLQRGLGLEGPTCPFACAPAEYHTRQML